MTRFRGVLAMQVKQRFGQQELYDQTTGEAMVMLPKSELDRLKTKAGEKPHKDKLPGGYFAMWTSPFKVMAMDRDIKGEDFRVFGVLADTLDDENWIKVAQKDVAEALGMNKQNVSRSIKRLVDGGYLFEGPKVGNGRTYRLNPHMGWKGPAAKCREARANCKPPSKVIQGPWKDQGLPGFDE